MLGKPIHKLRDWIDPDKLEWSALCHNPNAVPLFETHWEKIISKANWDLDWNETGTTFQLFVNPDIVPLLEKKLAQNRQAFLSTMQ